jgi:hypothetical protein
VYAYLTYRSRVAPLLIEINTRYGWVASPYPTGTCTPQETPGFARRDNVSPQARGVAASNWRRLLGQLLTEIAGHPLLFLFSSIPYREL